MTECPTCGKTFDATVNMKRHHAHAHNESIAGVDVECAVCGDTVRKRPHEVEDFDRNVCSDKCKREMHRQDMEGENSPNYTGGKSTYQCHQCGDTVKKYESRVENPNRVFCGRNCTTEWLRETDLFSGEDSPKYNKEVIECDYCGKEYPEHPSRIRRNPRNTCSQECSNKLHSERMRGDDNPNWKHGESDTHTYGPEWEQTRADILNRDGYECAICGLSNEAHKRSYQGSLEIHHITPIAEFETPAEANRSDNLIALCSRCHGRVEHGNTELRDKLAMVARTRTDS